MKSRERWTAAVLATVTMAGAAAWTIARGATAGDAADTARIPTATAFADSTPLEERVRELEIAFYQRRAAEDTTGAADRSRLAGLYMERGRASGAVADYERAERLARRSLELRTEHNGGTFALLASALLARHAFDEALAVARRADSLEPGVAARVALLGEIELEMGDYASANAHFSSIRFDGEQFTVAARLARWRELTGHADAARRLLRLAIARVERRDDLPREQVAWFHYRLAELELRRSHLDSAESAFRRGLAVFPGDHRILGGLARVAAARGEWPRAIDFGTRAIAIQLDPLALGTISEAYAALGDSVQSAQYARAMRASALAQPGPIHRAWGLFLLDHGSTADAKRVLAKVRAEMRTRRDVYGYDLLAWALHRLGRHGEAREAMRHALAQGTEDAMLQRHAAAIALAAVASDSSAGSPGAR